MVNDQFYAVRLIVAVNFFIGRKNKFFKHSRRNKGRSLASPVVMMEDSIRLYVFADFFRILQFPIREVVDQLLGSFRLFVEIHQTVLDFLKVVALFKDAGSHKLGDKIFLPVNFFRFFYKRFPIGI